MAIEQLEALYRMESGQQDYTPAGALLAGAIVQLADGRAAVVKDDLAASQKGAVYTEGIIEVKSATATVFLIGAPVYWDTSANLAIIAPGDADDLYLGTAVVAKGSGPLTVTVDLNKGLAGFGSTGQRGSFTSRAVVVAHDSTAEHDLISSSENPAGLVVQSFYGVVTEAPVGSSEDQLEITLYDSDDNVLSVMITTNTTPTPADDWVIGTRALNVAATDVVACVIPATKGAYAKVSQATVGGSIAGEVRVAIIVAPLI